MRASVLTELNHLLKAGVTEQIDASQWASPIIVTGQKAGVIRICADLHDLPV